ncbi:MAG: cation:proton antiporter [Candidatus Nanosalina sp.]
MVLFLFDRFSHPALPAFIVAGVLIGGFFPAEEMINFTQIGLSFLVFIFGVKMNPERLSLVAGDSLKTTAFQLVTISAISAAAAMILNLSGLNAVIFVLTTTLSSTLVGLDLLEKEIDLNLAHGRLAESIHLNQDLVAVVFLMFLGTAGFTAETVAQGLLSGLAVLFIALVFRSYLMDRLASLTEGSRELMMLLSITVLVGFLGLTEVLRTSLALGSFAAGLAVSRYPHSSEILDTTGSLRDFFSAIFFVSLGALLSVPSPRILLLSAVMVFVTAVLKPYAVALALNLLVQNSRTSHLAGFSLGQVSEFSLVIAIQAYLSGMISGAIFQSVIITAVVSMMISSYTAKHGDRLYRLISRFEPLPSGGDIEGLEERPEDHIVVIGYDTQGERIVEKLKEEGAEFVVIENDPEKITELNEKDEPFIYGDVMEDETWREAGAENARLILSTVPLEKVSEKIMQLDSRADRILRSKTIDEASRFLDEGALYVSVPKILGSDLLLEHVEGLMEDREYRNDLRRRNMLEVRRYLRDLEG